VSPPSKIIEHEECKVDQCAYNPKAIEEKARQEVDYFENFSFRIEKNTNVGFVY